MHTADAPDGDVASYQLPYLVNKGAIVDISDMVSEWDSSLQTR